MVAINKLFHKKKNAKEEPGELDDYEIGHELGRGGFSIVKEVHRKGAEAGYATALKITPLSLIGSSMGIDKKGMKERLDRMLRISEQSTNPHIIGFLDYRIGKEDLFTFGELCRGGDMFERIVNAPQGHFTEDEAREMALNLMGAIRDIHSTGIIHRDIKPENIFYRWPDSSNGDIVLADFGCAIDDTEPHIYHRGAAGSPGYVAPEMAMGQPYNMLVDEFSAGVTIYEGLTGRSPFISQDADELNREVVERIIPFPKQYWGHLSVEAKHFVQRLVEKDPRKRMSAAEALDHPWISQNKLARKDTGDSTETVPSLVADTSESESETSEMGEQLTRVVTRSTAPRALSFGKPDPLAAACTKCAFSKKKKDKDLTGMQTASSMEMLDTSVLLEGKLSSAHKTRIAQLDSDASTAST